MLWTAAASRMVQTSLPKIYSDSQREKVYILHPRGRVILIVLYWYFIPRITIITHSPCNFLLRYSTHLYFFSPTWIISWPHILWSVAQDPFAKLPD